jgi:ER lumen protein retaining receptor
MWTFSIILESTCVLPQLLLLRQTTVPTVFDSYYLILLGSYRALYLVGWVWRAADPTDYHFDPISVIFGALQTALYIDFAWVYYGRQRVKLRAGGIVDADDLGRGWLVGRIIGKHAPGAGGAHAEDHDDDDDDEDDDDGGGHGRGRGNGHGPDVERGAFANRSARSNRWGPRGISVSADDGVAPSGEDAVPLADPDAFEDELSDDDEGAPPPKKATVEDSPWQD